MGELRGNAGAGKFGGSEWGPGGSRSARADSSSGGLAFINYPPSI